MQWQQLTFYQQIIFFSVDNRVETIVKSLFKWKFFGLDKGLKVVIHRLGKLFDKALFRS